VASVPAAGEADRRTKAHGQSLRRRFPALYRLPAKTRPSHGHPYWDYFKPGRMEAWLRQLAAIREVLTAGGGSLTQGALLHGQA